MAEAHLALLRAINLGPKNKISMPDLGEVFGSSGCKNVRTYIQSGNVIFQAAPDLVTRLPGLIRAAIEKRFGYNVPVILRALAEMRKVVGYNPFLKEGAAQDMLHVMFLADLPKPSAVKSLDPDRSPPNRFIVRGKEVYLFFPQGFAQNKLTGSYLDTKLGSVGTVRTWRTVTKLLELMEEQSSK